MKDIYKIKYNELQNIITSYERYNGKPKNLTYEGIKKYILNAIANSKRIYVQPLEDIDEKFKPFEDVE